jgi:nitroreductase
MDFLELAKLRYSSRKYKDKEIEKEKLDYVLEAGRVAPSANNMQPWIFMVVKDKNRDKLRACYHREWFDYAPVYNVICGNHKQAWKRSADGKDHCDIDVSIATDHMTLAATQVGLATCWVCNFDKQMVIDVLKLPKSLEPIAILPLAYPADEVNTNRHDIQRKKTEDVVYYEEFG